ncbi:MAG TPA: chemotaxis protein, partial [Deltaproteobacteria bacterium]|nr:chemotaxis protein [Deltaproteobacteria bacterium]
ALGIQRPKEYLWRLKYGDPHGKEFQQLINLLTTNETYFFREFDQLSVFAENCLQEVCTTKERQGKKKLRLWSAGCSTGEEPYTLSIILQQMVDDYHTWEVKILATDIDTEVLKKAQKGVYSKRSIKDVPEEYLQKYFIREGDNYKVKFSVKKPIQFRHLNLMDDKKMRLISGIDFIFCRNVLIYFDENSRRAVVSNFYESLNNGGYIFLGHSESMSRISSAFTLRRKNGFIVYQKVED